MEIGANGTASPAPRITLPELGASSPHYSMQLGRPVCNDVPTPGAVGQMHHPQAVVGQRVMNSGISLQTQPQQSHMELYQQQQQQVQAAQMFNQTMGPHGRPIAKGENKLINRRAICCQNSHVDKPLH